jgi:Fe2+ or Zn2+ uptake regulation protein
MLGRVREPRATLPRMTVLETIQASAPRGMSAKDLYQSIARQDDIALGSIYRVLRELERAGLVTRTRRGNEAAVFAIRRSEPGKMSSRTSR